MNTVIVRQVMKAVIPLMLLVSANFFLQGHNLPGGGFIAGVMASAAIALIYIIYDFDGVRKTLGRDEEHFVEEYIPVSSLGIAVAAGTGILSSALGLNFLNHRMGVLHLPIFGKIHWTTAMLFDFGVFLAVSGSLLAIVEVLGEK
ncbi:MAG: MnhB domain-containing protein [Candidatus Nanosalina sp.]